ncbi:hypothetical protein DXT63_17815, partial [Thermoanaerobacteraceae bacterium SP2]
ATARKLLHIIWAVLTRQEEYMELTKNLLERKLKSLTKQAQAYVVDMNELLRVIDGIEDVSEKETQSWLFGTG